ncbi:hypothetical protein FQ707_01530 [Bacteroidaceae bacterium HV4-6-C5C]|nr:hypothetical protein FQ707_01530 [Bacteroidaceae bacterium HV4-6-C5C]
MMDTPCLMLWRNTNDPRQASQERFRRPGLQRKGQDQGHQYSYSQTLSQKVKRLPTTETTKSTQRQSGHRTIIGHLKQDHRLSRNFYKGDFGDAMNVLLAAAAFNFKSMMNKFKQKIAHIWQKIQAMLLGNLLLKSVLEGRLVIQNT